MPHFDWRRIQDPGAEANPWPALAARYASAEGAAGIQLWRDFVATLQDLAGRQDAIPTDTVLGAIDAFIATARSVPPPPTATLFVSHQRSDAAWAERVAWDATRVGFDYWLDVHDTTLSAINATRLIPGPIKAALITGIIEIALLNSTHLVSLQTVASRTSRWVPYEFGRAKDRRMLSTRTASWFQNGVTLDPAGDYLAFAECAYDKLALRRWLRWVATHAGLVGVTGTWRGGSKPADLPN
jgi:hypothetical protein